MPITDHATLPITDPVTAAPMHFPTMACRIAAHPLSTVFLLALLVRLINVAFLTGNESFFAETDAFAYWKLGAGLARPESD